MSAGPSAVCPLSRMGVFLWSVRYDSSVTTVGISSGKCETFSLCVGALPSQRAGLRRRHATTSRTNILRVIK